MAFEQVFVSPARIGDLRSNPSGVQLESYCDWLLSSGFCCKRRSKSAALLRGVSPIEKYSAYYPCSLILSKTYIYRMIDAGHTMLRIVREMSDYRHVQVDEHPSRYSRGRHEQA